MIEDAKAEISNEYRSNTFKPEHTAKFPIISPLFENNTFISDFTAEAEIFDDYFLLQCIVIDTGSAFPNDVPFHLPPLTTFHISDETILRIIRSLNPNKAHGWDNVSVRMIKIGDEVLVVLLRLIFEKYENKGIFLQIGNRLM